MADAVAAQNAGTSFPPSVSVSGPALFSKGNIVQSASLIPGFNMQLNGFSTWQPAVGQTRYAQYQSMLTFNSGLTMIQAADKVRQDAVSLSDMLASLPPASPFTRPFPSTTIGQQLLQVAQIMQLQPTIGLNRQIFFCSLGGFDTHSGQSWQQFDLLRQVADAMLSLYSATQDLGIANQVTTFTESEFGRTLQPSGIGLRSRLGQSSPGARRRGEGRRSSTAAIRRWRSADRTIACRTRTRRRRRAARGCRRRRSISSRRRWANGSA